VPTTASLIGQKLVVRMSGTTPSPALLGRIERGEVGGVILFAPNIRTPAALHELTASLQAAAAKGRQPTLLIGVDQEGGEIKRIPWAPPTLTPAEMGGDGRPSVARDQGLATASALRDLGINVDFAPVADVPSGTDSFMAAAGRTFAKSSATVSEVADAFAAGLEAGGVLPSLKHFPGIGLATQNTDSHVVVIGASRDELGAGLQPYQAAISQRIPLIMLSNATYPAFDATDAAGWSSAIGDTLLRHDMGFEGVTITDSLDGTAKARGVASVDLAELAAKAGTDMLLLTGTEETSAGIFRRLVKDVKDGSLEPATLLASYQRILALKSGLAPG
jgi:beta-N-acetylhexosaminidase